MDSSQNVPWRKRVTGGDRQSSHQSNQHNPRKRTVDTLEGDWVAGEDRFVLQQAKRKAELRVRDGRARPVDWLAVTLRFVDPARKTYDDEVPDSELNIVDPEGVFEGLDETQLVDLEKEIDFYKSLEETKTNQEYWNTMLVISEDRRRHSTAQARGARGVESVSSEVDQLLGSKSLDQLESLEKQIKVKLQSDGPVDVEYWEYVLMNLTSRKAKAKLRKISKSIIDGQLKGLRAQQHEEAWKVQEKVASLLGLDDNEVEGKAKVTIDDHQAQSLDPEPLLKIGAEDRAIPIYDERTFLVQVANDRKKVLKLGYVPANPMQSITHISHHTSSNSSKSTLKSSGNDNTPFVTTNPFDREVARGVGENEELFFEEEAVTSNIKYPWAHKHKPRKPRYFNRVQMGYDWNKYNQTHYDHDNPPPRVIHGYKFNIFYPDLVDKSKAPTYKIEREHGRKRGESFAPAGKEDNCFIRFIAGAPYEEVAFRIVDKEWDYSAKRERGFKSSYDKDVLQLHFQFKKIFYRK